MENVPQEAPEPLDPVTEGDVEGHGIEEDDGDDSAASFTVTGVCI
jgi:hypothetical protein